MASEQLEIRKKMKTSEQSAENGEEIIEEMWKDHIPFDCLYEIFRMLPIPDKINVEKVCKRWKGVSSGGWSGEKRLSIAKHFIHTDETNIYDLEEHHALGCLTLENWCLVLQRCGAYLKKLRIDITGNEFVFSSTIAKSCKQLEEIRIERLGEDYPTCADELLRNFNRLFEKNSKIGLVEMWISNANLRDEFVDVIPKNIVKFIIRGDIPRRCALTMYGDGYRTREPLNLNLLKFRSIKVLHLHSFSLDTSSLRGLDKLEHLKELHFYNCSLSKELLKILPNLKELENLKFHSMTFGDDDMIPILKECTKLRKMHLFSMNYLTHATIKAVSDYRPELEELFVEFSNQFFFSTQPIPLFNNLKRLKCYDWEYDVCENRIVELVKHSPKLEFLSGRYDALTPYLKEIETVIAERQPPTCLTIQMLTSCGNQILQQERLQSQCTSGLLKITCQEI